MKRGWIGFVLLVVLLLGGCLSTWQMVRWHSPLEERMEQAAQRALSSDWDGAMTLSQRVKRDWEEHWHAAAAFADHGPMEQIDALFARLEVYEQERVALAYAVLCRELARELAAMGDAHIPNWWNLL